MNRTIETMCAVHIPSVNKYYTANFTAFGLCDLENLKDGVHDAPLYCVHLDISADSIDEFLGAAMFGVIEDVDVSIGASNDLYRADLEECYISPYEKTVSMTLRDRILADKVFEMAGIKSGMAANGGD